MNESSPRMLRHGDRPTLRTAILNDTAEHLTRMKREVARYMGWPETRLEYVDTQWAKIDDSADYSTGPLYQLIIQRLTAGLNKDVAIQTVDNGNLPEAEQTIRATNLVEIANNSHTVPPDTVVLVWRHRDSATGHQFNYFCAAAPGLFPVRVQKDGGSQGSQAGPATYTYTVQDVGNHFTIARNKALDRPRPNGRATYYTSGGNPTYGYGFGFYAGTTFVLWDAGEIYNTGSCP